MIIRGPEQVRKFLAGSTLQHQDVSLLLKYICFIFHLQKRSARCNCSGIIKLYGQILMKNLPSLHSHMSLYYLMGFNCEAEPIRMGMTNMFVISQFQRIGCRIGAIYSDHHMMVEHQNCSNIRLPKFCGLKLVLHFVVNSTKNIVKPDWPPLKFNFQHTLEFGASFFFYFCTF